jgi:hypothetical protein
MLRAHSADLLAGAIAIDDAHAEQVVVRSSHDSILDEQSDRRAAANVVRSRITASVAVAVAVGSDTARAWS